MTAGLRSTVLAFVALAGAAPALAAQVGSPAGPVPPEYLEARRQRLTGLLEGSVAVLGSARARDLEGDYPQDSDFRQDNDFFYLTGLEVPRAWLVLAPAGGPVLFIPPRDPAQERWTGPQLGPGPEAAALSGVADVRSTEELGEVLRELTGTPGADLYLSLGDPRNAQALDEALGGRLDGARPLAPLTARLRLVKDEEEIRRLEEAVDITADAQREAWRLAEPGLHEYELEAAIEYVFRARGAERVGFPSIVGGGRNSTVLHYDKNRRRLEEGDLVVADLGAEYGYYTADITRTFPVSGTFTPRQRAVYELVLGAQEAALERVRPGVTVAELTRVARAHIDEHSAGLCGGSSCNRYFIHGLSHWLGMDVHDVGDYSTPLEPGMVLTIEPGIYIPDEALGVRIEDDVLVTDDGYRLLSGDLPRTPDEIEGVMAQDPRWTRPVGDE